MFKTTLKSQQTFKSLERSFSRETDHLIKQLTKERSTFLELQAKQQKDLICQRDEAQSRLAAIFKRNRRQKESLLAAKSDIKNKQISWSTDLRIQQRAVKLLEIQKEELFKKQITLEETFDQQQKIAQRNQEYLQNVNRQLKDDIKKTSKLLATEQEARKKDSIRHQSLLEKSLVQTKDQAKYKEEVDRYQNYIDGLKKNISLIKETSKSQIKKVVSDQQEKIRKAVKDLKQAFKDQQDKSIELAHRQQSKIHELQQAVKVQQDEKAEIKQILKDQENKTSDIEQELSKAKKSIQDYLMADKRRAELIDRLKEAIENQKTVHKKELSKQQTLHTQEMEDQKEELIQRQESLETAIKDQEREFAASSAAQQDAAAKSNEKLNQKILEFKEIQDGSTEKMEKEINNLRLELVTQKESLESKDQTLKIELEKKDYEVRLQQSLIEREKKLNEGRSESIQQLKRRVNDLKCKLSNKDQVMKATQDKMENMMSKIFTSAMEEFDEFDESTIPSSPKRASLKSRSDRRTKSKRSERFQELVRKMGA